MAQTFGQAFIVADYYINTASFAKNCENKARPKLQCNGKCQMMKKLKAQEKKEQQGPERKSSYKNISISSKSFFIAVEAVSFLPPVFYAILNSDTPVDRTSGIFRPPKTGQTTIAATGSIYFSVQL